MPLVRPYRLSYRTFETFEPFVVEMEDTDGRVGMADALISPGSSEETPEGGWAFCIAQIRAVLGCGTAEAKAKILASFESSKVATTALVCAIEFLEDSPFLTIPQETRLPLLTPVNALDAAAIAPEIEDWIGKGFRTFKVKVGKDVQADLDRVKAIQHAVAGRATLRLDANRAFSRTQAETFARSLEPTGIELFEQPCDSKDWEANAAVAAASPVPLMLDEPICTLADIERAADIRNVGFCKLKLKRFGSMERLHQGLEAVRSNGMEPVLGDGLGSELHNWLEACVARTTICNAGEFNGFLKPKERLFTEPMPFENGAIVLPAGYRPQVDRERLARLTAEEQTFQL
jgi:L-alanine-DL-glutamate epimerase-like enolase superfamily enzyme